MNQGETPNYIKIYSSALAVHLYLEYYHAEPQISILSISCLLQCSIMLNVRFKRKKKVRATPKTCFKVFQFYCLLKYRHCLYICNQWKRLFSVIRYILHVHYNKYYEKNNLATCIN